MGRNSWVRVLVVAAAAACLELILGTAAAHAQPPEPWSDPVMISAGLLDEAGQPLSSGFPVLVTDPWGIVHAFWPELPGKYDSQNGTMYYSRWDGSVWTEPVDVLFSKGRPMRSPSAAVDTAGQIRLAWTVGAQGPVWTSRTPASQAGSAQAWSRPEQVTESSAMGLGLAIDAAGKCHIVFCVGGNDQRCYYTASTDGNTWTTATSIHSPCQDCSARVAVDGAGRIHTIFGSQATGGKAMYYSRSVDGGRTWLAAEELDRSGDRFSENYGPSWGTVAAVGLDEVHLIWFGAPAGQRWHRWSRDGGATWSEAQQISADQRGLTLPVATAFDSAGSLHLVSMGWRDVAGRPSGPFHFVWRSGKWSEPHLIGAKSDWDAEYAALTVAGGNQLVALWTDKEGPKESFQIWASTLRSDAPPQEPRRLEASAQPSATPKPTPGSPSAGMGSEDVRGTLSPTETAVSAVGLGARHAQEGWPAYLLGVAPPLLLLVLVLAVRASRQRRGG